MTQLGLFDVCQRWRTGRTSYRPAGEPIDPRRYEVAPLAGDAVARAFICQHHYSGAYVAPRRRFGLYRGEQLVGVAVFSVPAGPEVLAILPDPEASAHLGRFVLLDDVPANGETFFLARCFEQLRREGFSGALAFSDDIPRSTLAGDRVFRGHLGTIYQAHNAVYTGRGAPRTLRLLPSGQVFSDRAAQKIRKRDEGWRYAVQQLVDAGAVPLADDEDARAWLRMWQRRVTRALRHPGCHRYIWPLDRATRLAIPERFKELNRNREPDDQLGPQPYPKHRLEVAS